jgi:hypothetical protein
MGIHKIYCDILYYNTQQIERKSTNIKYIFDFSNFLLIIRC